MRWKGALRAQPRKYDEAQDHPQINYQLAERARWKVQALDQQAQPLLAYSLAAIVS